VPKPDSTAPVIAAATSRDWSSCPAHRLAGVRGIFTDIDDTLTRDGMIEPVALQSLHRLNRAGLPVIAVTGRPMGWSLPFAREWPVLAIVAENGAVALQRDAAADDGVRTLYVQDEAVRCRNSQRLKAVAQQILDAVPGTRLARDSPGRVTDMAIDHSEFTHLPPAAIDQVVALMQRAGMAATVSSIHINGWFGDHSKWTGAQWILRETLGRELLQEVDDWVYVGDSTNDQPMFERFSLSVGVANLRRFEAQLQRWPSFITQAERGAGFAEVAQAVLLAKGLLE
jgi:HAD superfamily hydrolase (TIGR01484 family)